ncbi:hypothetical protein L596_008746 [Steinernema carpocapsae]|uniref:G-protein coupled receptors family 1 profile domain-containing protein n=1 Tax=Steinernema carpocapsae TaxID=34508 RepID=A0A4U5PDM8_STECR|nr:hypothetical protein L596_008746 [Steinernema carpocapsae]
MSMVTSQINTFLFQVILLAAFCFACITFVLYMRERKSSELVGTLLLHNIACIQYCLLKTVYNFFAISSIMAPSWISNESFTMNIVTNTVVSGAICSQQSIYLAGMLIAIDRVILLAFPLFYKFHAVSKRLAQAGTVFCLVLFSTVLTFDCILPLFGHTTFIFIVVDLVYYLEKIFNWLLCVEVVLHVIFCVFYWRFSKKQSNLIKARRTRQVNHIVFCQLLSLTVFCATPQLVTLVDQTFFHSNVNDILRSGYVFTLFAIHVLITSAFTFLKLFKQPSAVNVASNPVGMMGGSRIVVSN